MEEPYGLRQIGELPTEGFESQYNNYIGFDSADLYESHHEMYGGRANAPSYPLFIHCFVDEFNTEIVESIESDDDGVIIFNTATDFEYQINWLLGEFFTPESSALLGGYSEGIWNMPTMVIVHFYCPDPETFDDEICWAARFTREDFQALGDSPGLKELIDFLEKGKLKNDEDAAKLFKLFGD